MTDSGKIKLLLEGDVPPPLTKRGEPKKAKTPGRPTSMKRAMVKEPREKISNLRKEILILFMVPYSEHDKYEVKLVKDEPHIEFVLNGESALGDLGLSRHEKLNVVISFIKRPKEPNCVVAPYSRPRRQAAEDAKAIIPIALKNDEKLRHAERKANKKNNDKQNKRSRDDGSSFSGMGVRLNDEKKIGRPSIPEGKACKIRGVFGGVGRVLANSNPVLQKEKLVMGCKLNKSDIAEILLSAISAKNNPEFEGLHAQWKYQLEEERKESKALSRLMAVSTGNYAIKVLKSGSKVGDGYLVGGETHAAKVDRYGRSHGGSKSFIEVFFGNKIERRLMQTEVVELLSYNAVKVLVEYGHNIPSKSDSEEPDFKLRPLFVAGIPSYFWSLVHHCSNSSLSVTTSVEDMLKYMQPELDWSHLERGGRSRTLSEKAKENRRQELEAHGDNNEGDATDIDWDLDTPSKDDKEGLVECIGPGELVDDFISILASLSEPHECKNPRQLANADPEVLFAHLNNKCGKNNIPPPELSSVRGWVDTAQEVSVEEIMLEIVDGDEEVLRCLHSIGAASPWDLTCYEEESDFLAGKMVEMGMAEEYKEVVLSWIWRAQRALTVCPWLIDFSST